MKTLKKLIAMLLALAAICSMAACDKEEELSPEKELERELEQALEELMEEDYSYQMDLYGQPEAEPTEEEPVSSAKYESDVLRVFAETASAKDIFAGFADDAQNMFYTTDGRLLSSYTLDDDFGFGGVEPQEIFVACNEAVYTDAKGYTYIKTRSGTYPCADIRGEIFWFFTDMLSGNLHICSRDEEGNMYLNEVDHTGIKERDNEKLYLYEYETKTYIENVDFVRMVQDDQVQENIYAEVNGKAYYENVTGIRFFDDKAQIWVSSKNCWDAQNVVEYGYGGANSPLFKKEGDNTALYYNYGWNGTELPVYMPQGKTIDQLERVVFGEVTYLFFTDGNVYSGVLVDTIVGPDIVRDETLTKLNKAGSIRDVFQSTFIKSWDCKLRLLMDDNVTYEYIK